MRKWLFLLSLAFLSPALLVYSAGTYISAPRYQPVAAPPSELAAMPVVFDDLHGWWVKAKQPNGDCVLLMHGVGSDRSSMLGRARLLQAQGYSSLLFDFQAHGESPGQHITFGVREAGNAASALAYLHTLGQCRKTAVIGQSLGGAASLLGDGPLSADAFILEAVYPSIEQAVSNRLAIRLGAAGRLLTPLLTLQIPLRLDVALESLRPIEAIKRLEAPVLIIAGSLDRHTPLAESRALYNSAPQPKELWIVEGAIHTDFYAYAPREYERKILNFLSVYLKQDELHPDLPGQPH